MFQDLPPQPTTVEAVSVLPARLSPAASEPAFSVIRLEEEQLEGFQRLDQALSQAPGVDLFRRTDSLSSNPTTQGISLRSIAPSGAGRALVLLDGVPQNDPFGGWVIWAGLPSELLESVSILRGGGSGPYGSGALTGVISLDERTDYGVLANVRGGELGTARGAVVVSKPAGPLDILFGVAAGSTDGYVPVRSGAGAADTPTFVEDWSVNLRATTDLAGGRLAFRVGAYDEDRGSGLLGANARADGSHASVTLARNPGQERRGYRLQAWVRESNLYNSSVSVPAGRATTTLANVQYDTPATGYGVNAALRGGDSSRQWEVGLDVRHAQGETRELFSLTAPNGPFTRQAGGKALVAGVYGEGTLKSGPWLFTGGVRVDEWSNSDALRIERNNIGTVTLNAAAPDRDGSEPTARVGVRRETGFGYVRGAAYMGFRSPTLNELHRPFRVGNITTLANPALEPEKLEGFEAGIGGGGDTSAWSVTVFYNELTDAITNVTIGANLRERQNAGSVEAVGLEAEGSKDLNPYITMRAAIAYTDAETDAGLRPAQTAKLAATAGVDWRATERLTLGAQLRHDGERFDDDLNTVLLEEATVVDLRAEWDFGRGVTGFVAADNVFDEPVQNGLTSGEINYAAPRIISFGLSLRR